MKSSVEYLHSCRQLAHGETLVVPLDEAVQAVQTALDDADEYRRLLLRAVRKRGPEGAFLPNPLNDE